MAENSADERHSEAQSADIITDEDVAGMEMIVDLPARTDVEQDDVGLLAGDAGEGRFQQALDMRGNALRTHERKCRHCGKQRQGFSIHVFPSLKFPTPEAKPTFPR